MNKKLVSAISKCSNTSLVDNESREKGKIVKLSYFLDDSRLQIAYSLSGYN